MSSPSTRLATSGTLRAAATAADGSVEMDGADEQGIAAYYDADAARYVAGAAPSSS